MSQTRTRMLAEAEALMRAGGPSAVTYDAIAQRVGVSKQAVIYWFRNKAQLLAAIALSCLEAEAETAIAAARTAASPMQARRAVVLALTGFHLADLPRFRMMYAAPQMGMNPEWARDMLDRVHPLTARMYTAIAAALGEGDEEARRAQAVALHMAALGHVLLVAMTDAVGDPLRHGPEALAQSLADMLAGEGG